MIKQPELLAPAGSYEAFIAALYANADAVYLGIKNYGARAFCDNFDQETLSKIIKVAHLNRLKIYVTLNTLINEEELSNVLKEVDRLYKLGVDAVLVQDLGLAYCIKKKYPDFELHASTQMNINDPSSCDFLERFGFKRVVLARESSLETIQQFTKSPLEVEVFVHGALCIAYSGQCLLSSSLDQRSGNKGICAQYCRMLYEVYDLEKKQALSKPQYLLSPKDLCVIDRLEDLLKLNVASLKIEGRMKSPSYVYLVTSLYRKALNAFLKGEKYKIDQDHLNELKIAYNRDFTLGHIFHKAGDDLYNRQSPKHQGLYLGYTTKCQDRQFSFKLEHNLKRGDALRLLTKDQEEGYIVNEIYLHNKQVVSASRGETITLPLRRKLKAPFKIYLTKREVDLINHRPKFPSQMELKAYVSKLPVLTLHFEDFKVEIKGDEVLPSANKIALDEPSAFKQLAKLNDTVYELQELKLCTNGVFMPSSKLNELRRRAIEELDALRLKIKRENLPCRLNFKKSETSPYRMMIEVCTEEQYLLLKDYKHIIFISSSLTLSSKYPAINYLRSPINERAVNDPFLRVSSQLSDLGKHKIAYYTLNIANSSSISLLRDLGYSDIILSTELNENNLAFLTQKIDDLSGLYYMTYGRRDLMYLKRDPLYGNSGKLGLRDLNKRVFPLYKDDEGLSHLLENEPLDRPVIKGLRPFWRLTVENRDEVMTLIKEKALNLL